MSGIWFYVQVVLAAAIGLALNETVTEFVDTVCSRHILACMTPSYILELFHVRKTIQIKNFKDELTMVKQKFSTVK